METALKIVFQPQAVFRVRPVARCTASLPGHSEAVLSVSFSPNGRHLASGSGDTTLRLWDLQTQTPMHTCQVGRQSSMRSYAVSQFQCQQCLLQGHKNWVLCVAWSPDAQMVASGGMDNCIWLWDPQTGKALGCCRGHSKWITSLAWEPAHLALPSRRFCSGSKDATIQVATTQRCSAVAAGCAMA